MVRSLTYFEDAEKADARLVGLTDEAWSEIKEWFLSEAPDASALFPRRG